jgi:hypothetical protein
MENVKNITIKQVVNFGCSFAYGNRAIKFNELCSEHKNTSSFIADKLSMPVINLARPGNSNEGILDNILCWIAANDRKTIASSLVLVGWTNGARFGFVSNDIKASNKSRPGKNLGPVAEEAFTAGPLNPYRFLIDKWDKRWTPYLINYEETARLSLYRHALALQYAAKAYNIKYIQYHSLRPSLGSSDVATVSNENNLMKTMLVTDNFFSFESKSLQALTNDDPNRYFVSEKDSHPNHQACKEWADDIYMWMSGSKNFGWRF